MLASMLADLSLSIHVCIICLLSDCSHCVPAEGAAAAAEELYGKFCTSIREGNPADTYPQVKLCWASGC